MNIRRGKIQDLKEITAIEAECFPVSEAATEESFKGRLTVYPVCKRNGNRYPKFIR